MLSYHEICRQLGTDVVDEFERAVTKVYTRSLSQFSEATDHAVEALLVNSLAAIIATNDRSPACVARAQECSDELVEIVSNLPGYRRPAYRLDRLG